MRVLSIAVVCALSSAHGIAQTDEVVARELLQRMSAQYTAMKTSGCRMRVEIKKRTSSADGWQESRKEIRFVQKGNALRLEVGAPNQMILFLRRDDGSVIEYRAVERQFADPPIRPESAQTVSAGLERFRNTLVTRFADLAAAEPQITSAKENRIRIGRSQCDCLRIGMKAKTWTATIWIDRSTGLVWRSAMIALTQLGNTDEEITWLEINAGLDPQDEGLLQWQPPAGSKRVASIGVLVPH